MSISELLIERAARELTSLLCEGGDQDDVYLRYRSGMNIASRRGRQDTNFSLWDSASLERVRNECRYLFETSGNAQALVSGLGSYVIGDGLKVSVLPDDEMLEEFLEDVGERLDLPSAAAEGWERYAVDGEVFLRIYPQAGGETQLRFVEPDFVWQAGGGIENSYGVNTVPGDTERVVSYSITYPGKQSETVDAKFIFHLKNNARRNMKRGISDLYATYSELMQAAILRLATARGCTIRESIAYILQSANRNAFTGAGDSIGAEVTGVTTPVVATRQAPTDSLIHKIPDDLMFQEPPRGGSDSTAMILAALLDLVAARNQVPAWLISGADAGSSYASAVVAESPFHRRIASAQRVHCAYWRRILEAYRAIAIEQGLLGAETEEIKITLTGPDAQSRDPKAQTEAIQGQIDLRLISRQTASALLELDFEAEQELIEADEDYPEPANVPGPGDPNTMNGKQQKEVTKEEWDESKHPRDTYGMWTDVVQTDPEKVVPLHPVHDPSKRAKLQQSMETSGWQGRPILTISTGEEEEAITGSHRIYAARRAGLATVPVISVKYEDLVEAAADLGYDPTEIINSLRDDEDRAAFLEHAASLQPENTALKQAAKLMRMEVDSRM